MCANHYINGYPLCLLCYTLINLDCKLHNLKSSFTSLNDFTSTVIMFHHACVHACVQNVTWMTFDHVCYNIIDLGGKFLIDFFYKYNDITFTVTLVFHLVCMQIDTWLDIHYVSSAILGAI